MNVIYTFGGFSTRNLFSLFLQPCNKLWSVKFDCQWNFIDRVLQQISLHTAIGNFAQSDAQFIQPLRFDMDELIGRYILRNPLLFLFWVLWIFFSRLHTQNEYEKLEKRFEETSAELDNERRRVVELENRLSDLQDGVSLVSVFSRFEIYLLPEQIVANSGFPSWALRHPTRAILQHSVIHRAIIPKDCPQFGLRPGSRPRRLRPRPLNSVLLAQFCLQLNKGLKW